MRRLLVLVTLLTVTGGLGSIVAACGGNDKPPLTPDNVEADLEAGAPGAPAPGAPAPTGSSTPTAK